MLIMNRTYYLTKQFKDMRFKDFKLGQKLGIGFGLLIAIASVLGILFVKNGPELDIIPKSLIVSYLSIYVVNAFHYKKYIKV